MARPPHGPQPETELEEFFELSIDPLSILGFDGAFKRLNASFARLLGYTKAELFSRTASLRGSTANRWATNGVATIVYRCRSRPSKNQPSHAAKPDFHCVPEISRNCIRYNRHSRPNRKH